MAKQTVNTIQYLLDGFHAFVEVIIDKRLKSRTSNERVVVRPLKQCVNFYICLSRARQRTFRSFAGAAEPAKRSLVLTEIFTIFPLAFVDKVLHETIVEVFAS